MTKKTLKDECNDIEMEMFKKEIKKAHKKALQKK